MKPSREELFWSKVQDGGPSECWPWNGALDSGGYGIFISPAGRSAHRAAFFYTNGPIPAKKWILHGCNNPRCVNPKHLRAGTALDNSFDLMKRTSSGELTLPPRWHRHQPVLPSAWRWCSGATDYLELGPFTRGYMTNARMYALQKAQGVASPIPPPMYGRRCKDPHKRPEHKPCR